jgi:hypothetical protein
LNRFACAVRGDAIIISARGAGRETAPGFFYAYEEMRTAKQPFVAHQVDSNNETALPDIMIDGFLFSACIIRSRLSSARHSIKKSFCGNEPRPGFRCRLRPEPQAADRSKEATRAAYNVCGFVLDLSLIRSSRPDKSGQNRTGAPAPSPALAGRGSG